MQKIAASDKYGATARTNLKALSASKFKGNIKEACAKFYPEQRAKFHDSRARTLSNLKFQIRGEIP